MLKQLFNAMSLRERVLLTVFIWIGILVWASAIAKNYRTTRIQAAGTSTELNKQSQWFAERDSINLQLQEALDRLDPKKTYSSTRLVGRLDNFARTSGLNFNTNTPQTKEGDIFNVHTVRLAIRNANIGPLIEFDKKIKQESPYIGLQQIKITANKSDPRLLDAQFTVSSFELKEQAL